MQTSKRQLIRQQMIMRALGFYAGLIDGIWGPKTISAKKNWEMSGKFNPAYPNQGLPFADTDVVPSGMKFDRTTRLFNHRELTESMIEQFSGVQKPAESTAETQVPVEAPVEPANAVDAQTVAETKVETPAPTDRQNPNANKHHPHKHRG